MERRPGKKPVVFAKGFNSITGLLRRERRRDAFGVMHSGAAACWT